MKQKLKEGEKIQLDFAGKRHTFERISPFFLRVTTDEEPRLVSIEKTVEIRIDKAFYQNGYFFRWKMPIQAGPKTTLKFFLKLPLEQKLVVEAGKRDLIVESYHEATRKAWHGEVFDGTLCDFVEPEVYFEPVEGDFANLPLRVVNQSNEAKEIKKFVVNPDYLMLFRAQNGLFTNKVYVNIVGEGAFSMSYGTVTTKSAKKLKKIIQQKAKSPKKILTSFSPFKLAKDFGL